MSLGLAAQKFDCDVETNNVEQIGQQQERSFGPGLLDGFDYQTFDSVHNVKFLPATVQTHDVDRS